MSEMSRMELAPGLSDPLSLIEYHREDVRTFQKHISTTNLRRNEYPGDAVRFLRPEKGLYNPLIAGFYEETYADKQPAGDILAYDVHTMRTLASAARSAFVPDELARSKYNMFDARTLPLLINGFGESTEGHILNGHEVDPRRVRSGMCYGMRRVAAVITPLRVERTFYDEHKADILAGIQNLTGLTDEELERADGLVAELRPRY